MLARQLSEEEYFEELPQEEQRIIRRKIVRRNIQPNPVRRQGMIAFFTGAILCGMVLLVSSVLASETYELGHIQSEARLLEKSNETLRVDNARMKSHARIKDIAVRELGMTVPQETYFAGEQKKN
ncbi:MAG: cell division protein FtsL [Anaerovibrio sp.]|nr:cell division protein FtsL [Anaerovibrio sp.]